MQTGKDGGGGHSVAAGCREGEGKHERDYNHHHLNKAIPKPEITKHQHIQSEDPKLPWSIIINPQLKRRNNSDCLLMQTGFWWVCEAILIHSAVQMPFLAAPPCCLAPCLIPKSLIVRSGCGLQSSLTTNKQHMCHNWPNPERRIFPGSLADRNSHTKKQRKPDTDTNTRWE